MVLYCHPHCRAGEFHHGVCDTLIIVNLAGLIVVGFIGWMKIGAVKQQLMDLMSRDLAEVRRQMRGALDKSNRQDDQIAGNHEKILLMEVNIARIQDEIEAMSRKLAALLPPELDEDGEAAESEIIPPSE